MRSHDSAIALPIYATYFIGYYDKSINKEEEGQSDRGLLHASDCALTNYQLPITNYPLPIT